MLFTPHERRCIGLRRRGLSGKVEVGCKAYKSEGLQSLGGGEKAFQNPGGQIVKEGLSLLNC